MYLVRTVVMWLCSVAVLVAGTPSHGLVWCRTADGTVALEAAAADGGCYHRSDESSAAGTSTADTTTQNRIPCEDEAIVDGARHGTPSRVDIPKAVIVYRALPAFQGTSLDNRPFRRPLRRTAPLTAAPSSDGSFVRETVVLLV